MDIRRLLGQIISQIPSSAALGRSVILVSQTQQLPFTTLAAGLPLRHGSADPGFARFSVAAGMVVTAPSNRVRPAVLAVNLLPDLRVIDPVGRVVP